MLSIALERNLVIPEIVPTKDGDPESGILLVFLN